jgi:hypothetical protein
MLRSRWNAGCGSRRAAAARAQLGAESPARSLPSDLALAMAHAGSLFMLCLPQFAFPRNALMLFVCTFDVIFELTPIVRELFGHFVCPAWHIPTDCRRKVYDLTNLKFVRGHHLYSTACAR